MKKLTTLTLLAILTTVSIAKAKMINLTEYYGGKEDYIAIHFDEIIKLVGDNGKTGEEDRCIIYLKESDKLSKSDRITLEGLSCQQFVEKHKIQVD